MATVNLTDAWLRAAKPGTKRQEFRDAKTPGLALRITSNGAMAFAVRARGPGGAEKRVTLGNWPVLGLAEARREALTALAKIKAGIDVTPERAVARSAVPAVTVPTVAARWSEWLTAHERRWSVRYDREVRRLSKVNILPTLGVRAIADVGRADWIALVGELRDRPALAASLYRICNSFLSYAEAVGWIVEHPLPRKGASRIAPAVPSRDRVLTDQELAAIWRASADRSPRVRCFVRLLAATGCREDEAAGIAAGELDLAAGVWTLPGTRTKNGKPHVMPLPDTLAAELAALLPEGDPGCVAGFRLLGRRGGALSGFSKIKATFDRLSCVSGWRFHDLRRTCRSGLSELGVPAEVAERCLNHRPKGLVAVYDQHSYRGEVLTALRRWQARLVVIVGEAKLRADVVLMARSVA